MNKNSIHNTGLVTLASYADSVDAEMRAVLDAQPDLKMYTMMRYFLGFTDERGNPISVYGGKRFRSGLCLMLADFYGMKEKVVEIAASIELFHNFTLIHDDIEDNDDMRRGKPTVWKLWGINHGINTGDAQLTLAYGELFKSAARYPKEGIASAAFLDEQYRTVMEGQFLDFSLAEAKLDDPFVTRARCEEMMIKKTSVLVAAAAKVAGMTAGRPAGECEALWTYGLELGYAYQLYDDMTSTWGHEEGEGARYNDIVEKKKTQIILALRDQLSVKQREELMLLFDSPDVVSKDGVHRIAVWLEETKAYEQAWDDVQAHARKAKDAARELSIADNQKAVLCEIVDALLPSLRV